MPINYSLAIKTSRKKINKKIISEKIDIIDHFYRKHLKIKPKIAVTGLNPHCESILNIMKMKKYYHQ